VPTLAHLVKGLAEHDMCQWSVTAASRTGLMPLTWKNLRPRTDTTEARGNLPARSQRHCKPVKHLRRQCATLSFAVARGNAYGR
jgi:hypothetical protein